MRLAAGTLKATDDFREAMEQAGLVPPFLIPPGKLIRFPGVGKSNDNRSGWALLFEDGEGGVFGDWATGLSETWQAKRSTPRTPEQQAAFDQQVAVERQRHDKEAAQRHAAAAVQAQEIWDEATPATDDHPYLHRKQIQSYGLRSNAGQKLLVPVRIDGQLASLQFIPTEVGDTKLFLPDGATKGGRFVLGELSGATTILLCEGYATGASLFKATGYPTVVAFSAGNLLPVGIVLHKECPSAKIVVCADNDVRADNTPNTGIEAATRVAEAIQGLLAIPELDGKKVDFNDLAVAKGLDVVREAIQTVLAEGANILDQVYAFLGQFVAFPSEAAHVAVMLWIAHTHLMEQWESTPRLAFLSPEPGSGKTRAMEIAETLVPRPIDAINVSSAYLFRKIGDPDGMPTILHDEIDTIFGARAKEHEDIRGLINAGHRRGAMTGRCVTKGRQIEPEEFQAFCAVAMAGLGNLPDTILSRSIIIRMRRRAPSEMVLPYRQRIHSKEGNKLRDKLIAWANQVRGSLNLYPEMPDGITDRNADIWESLLTIADAAGGTWPERARVTAVTLVTDAMGERDTASLGVRLLTDLKGIFETAEAFSTLDLIQALVDLQESPWGDLKGKEITPRLLARYLRPYGVTSKPIRILTVVVKGYAKQDFYDAWTRYVTPPVNKDEISLTQKKVTRVTPVTLEREREEVQSVSLSPMGSVTPVTRVTPVVDQVLGLSAIASTASASSATSKDCSHQKPKPPCYPSIEGDV